MTDDLEKAFEAAAAIAKKLPENLQETAFNRALDQLLGRDTRPQQRSGVGRKNLGQPGRTDQSDDWIDSIDRTLYTDINATSRIADQALKVLHLAHIDHGIDGLTASQVARILTDKFRVGVKVKAVSMALQRERGTVNVRRTADGTRFHIMSSGEKYLEELRARDLGAAAREKSGSQKSTYAKSPKVPEKSQAAQKKLASTGPKRHGRPGAKAAVIQLVKSGFFDSHRTISDVQEELKHKRGHAYTLQELSPALLRVLRDEMLERKRTEGGQYEYTKI